ncbi:MAG: lipid A biosynthesis protein [Alphaproteobacteria bacterium]|nr:lipid A biosynthesis protein [Alphaproteobacteria bacterium]
MAAISNWITVEHVWLLIGFLGQALFASRFIIQWFKSELVGRSVIPLSFWYCSLSGGIVLLTYAIYRQDPVFIAGQATGLIVYSRNLFLISKERKAGLLDTKTGAPPG